MGPSLRAFELVDVQPPRIVITADTLAERSVPIRAVLESPLRSGALTVENVTVSPASVTLRGPEGVISSINNLPLGIRLDPKAPAPRWSRPCCWIPPAWSPPTPPR